MSNNLYEKAKELIVKAVPEIMELRRGSLIEFRNKIGIFLNFGDGNLECPLPLKFILNGSCRVRSERKEEMKILGRKIGIADVLRAIGEKDNSIIIDVYGIFKFWNGKFLEAYTYRAQEGHMETIRFPLEFDDLSLASPECLQFIINILEK